MSCCCDRTCAPRFQLLFSRTLMEKRVPFRKAGTEFCILTGSSLQMFYTVCRFTTTIGSISRTLSTNKNFFIKECSD